MGLEIYLRERVAHVTIETLGMIKKRKFYLFYNEVWGRNVCEERGSQEWERVWRHGLIFRATTGIGKGKQNGRKLMYLPADLWDHLDTGQVLNRYWLTGKSSELGAILGDEHQGFFTYLVSWTLLVVQEASEYFLRIMFLNV